MFGVEIERMRPLEPRLQLAPGAPVNIP
jgi:hypothetical protein